ncbi:hypothetical protein EVAR_26062_1 [Eumeta japonica]|uniref:Uncharacterized protein n=1 Tax=Eumeta variegata TaxID=151549 RepID=A0A4C1VQP4_EUMVA|nr:hypothetical protein EVAR_26062_1 [Eumeta japonica]
MDDSLELRVSMGGGNHLLSDGSRARLNLVRLVTKGGGHRTAVDDSDRILSRRADLSPHRPLLPGRRAQPFISAPSAV